MIAAPLLRGQAKATRHICVPGAGPTEMNHRGQILLLLERGPTLSMRTDGVCYGAVEQGGGQLDGMAGQDTAVEAVEPAGVRIVPRAVLNDTVVMDAVPLPFLKGRVGDLEHADCARRRTIQFQRIPGQSPAPVSARDRIARAFDLRQRGQQIRRHDGGGMCAEERAVFLPCFVGVFIERVVEREEHFRRFVDRMVNPVHTCAEQEKGGQAHHQSDRDGQASQGGEEGSISMPPGAPAPTNGRDRAPVFAPPATDDSLRMRAGRHGLTITQK